MKLRFSWLAWFFSIFEWLLGAAWLLIPGVLYSGWGLPPDATGQVMAWRTAALYAGIGLILFLVRNLAPSRLRRGVAIACAVTSGGMGVAASAAYLAGLTSAVFILVIGVWEIVVAIAFLLVERFEPAARAARRAASIQAAPEPEPEPQEV